MVDAEDEYHVAHGGGHKVHLDGTSLNEADLLVEETAQERQINGV